MVTNRKVYKRTVFIYNMVETLEKAVESKRTWDDLIKEIISYYKAKDEESYSRFFPNHNIDDSFGDDNTTNRPGYENYYEKTPEDEGDNYTVHILVYEDEDKEEEEYFRNPTAYEVKTTIFDSFSYEGCIEDLGEDFDSIAEYNGNHN